jgi:flavin reductase (DIM6/NTAB) family NADH-FMN oxidoreductase RutF
MAESPVNLECRGERIIKVGQDRLPVGEMLAVHVRDGSCRDGTIDGAYLRPVARPANEEDRRLGELLELDRPCLREVT